MEDGTRGKNGAAPWRRLLCAAGIVLAVIGVFFVSVALGAVGIVLGVVGYALGARRLGVITVVLGVVSIFVGLLVGQGVMAGSYDRAVDGWFRNTPSEQITDELRHPENLRCALSPREDRPNVLLGGSGRGGRRADNVRKVARDGVLRRCLTEVPD